MIQDLPFGGCKDSGFGRFNGPEGLREFCRLKSVVGVYWNSAGPMAFPAFMRRPIPAITVPLISKLLTVFYGWGLGRKVSALGSILALAVRGPQEQKKQQ